jgi:hypothetical protein
MLLGMKFMFQNVLDLKFGLIQRKQLLLTALLLESGIQMVLFLDIIQTSKVTTLENLVITIFIQLLLLLHRTTPATMDKML